MPIDARTCYFPHGNTAANSYPCTSDDTTFCCGKDNICLSNGYCLDTVQPFVLSRGSCTSQNWGAGCPTHCQDTFDDKGASIINLSFINGTSKYCCGTPVINGSEIVCPFEKDSFEIDDGEILAGHTALQNVTSLSASSNSSNSSGICPTATSSPSSSGSHDVAIGAGLGVPLGLVALGSLVWAFMERRRANRLSKAMANSTAPGPSFNGAPVAVEAPSGKAASRPSELDSRGTGHMPELEARG
ncbi:hypothetical protein N7532_006485 [Penicillium argentinense]|uniref:Uncharacterized protein n=1 Tax=Penicillium argentinense TaxID=1131581 RepID=A0A9W9FG34_9EURO|nr:uncharacterized protein N7532_006485 [Penicillium argentinense]KAJ5099484.1 hypothetical protein N7532_006485 [Penicillium argentinense]